jgi:hypothetical protein
VGKQAITLFAAALAVAMVVTGCGGGDSSTASITKAKFIKQADAACKKGEEEIQKNFAVYVKKHKVEKPTEDDYAELIEVVLLPSAEQEIDDIRALGAPSGDEDQVEALLEAREASLEKAQAEPKLVIQNSKKIFGEASQMADEYGLKDCGNR